MLKWFVLIATIVAEVAGSLALKAGLHNPWWYVVTAVGYIGAFGLLSLVLKLGMPVGVAYGIWGACGVALTAIFSWVLFAEPLAPVTLVGIGAIMIGVLLVEIGSQQGAKRQEAALAAAGESPALEGETGAAS